MEELKFFTVCKTIVRKGFSVMCWSICGKHIAFSESMILKITNLWKLWCWKGNICCFIYFYDYYYNVIFLVKEAHSGLSCSFRSVGFFTLTESLSERSAQESHMMLHYPLVATTAFILPITVATYWRCTHCKWTKL